MPFGPQGQEARYDPRHDFLSKRVAELIEENRELKEDKKSFRNASNQYQTELAKAKDEIEQMRKELRVKDDEIQNLKRSMGEPQKPKTSQQGHGNRAQNNQPKSSNPEKRQKTSGNRNETLSQQTLAGPPAILTSANATAIQGIPRYWGNPAGEISPPGLHPVGIPLPTMRAQDNASRGQNVYDPSHTNPNAGQASATNAQKQTQKQNKKTAQAASRSSRRRRGGKSKAGAKKSGGGHG